MDVIREHLMYKDVPITICMKDLKPGEQYEVIRILLATRMDKVKICTHESVNEYITELLKKLPVEFVQCFVEEQQLLMVPLLEEAQSQKRIQ
jgi:hypothetical protein